MIYINTEEGQIAARDVCVVLDKNFPYICLGVCVDGNDFISTCAFCGQKGHFKAEDAFHAAIAFDFEGITSAVLLPACGIQHAEYLKDELREHKDIYREYARTFWATKDEKEYRQ